MDDENELDPDLVIEVARQIDAAAKQAADANELVDRFHLPEDNGPLRSVAMAFGYSEAKPKSGKSEGHFGPCISLNDGSQYPPPLDQLPPEESALWEAVANAVTEPVARARLNDIAFEAKWGHPGKHARAAIESYLSVPARPTHHFDEAGKLRANIAAVKSLARALDLARLIKATDQSEAALAAAEKAAAGAMNGTSPGPGVVLGLIEILVNDAAPADRVLPLLEKARAVYTGNTFITVAAIDLQLRVAGLSREQREQLRRDTVQTWIAEAERNSGAVRMAHLETAVKIARKYSFNDLVDEITGALQAITVDELGLVRSSLPIEIPREAVEGYLDHITGASSWHDALRLLISAPPSGNVDSNRSAVAEGMSLAPLRALFPKVRLGGDGLPRYTASSEDEKIEWQLAEIEIRLAHVQAPLIAEALRRIWRKWGPIPENDLASFLSKNSHVQQALGRALARDFLRHFGGDAEGAAYSTAPRVEALARAITLAIPLPVYRTQREKTPGQYPGLGALMPGLIEAGLDESWGRYITTLLASPIGENLRNELLHGFVSEVGELATALILVAALYLAIGVQLREDPPNDIDSQAAEPPAH
ncbi:DUF4209 domain-containing protein [Sinomonas susongensis]|uniref:DUF4209 domain-containing protein n=1 Tax=Sinomonas susongensis TaxID=1324851 RepID=UPI0011092AE9|nr:DUF4209 domain-containing protein [Sinomonas susongensis]